MTPIDPNAVINAIATWPDGFDASSDGMAHQLEVDLGILDDDDDRRDDLWNNVMPDLHADRRLRETAAGDTAISFSEQARRIALALGIDNAFEDRCETIANVLAGKTEKT